MKLIINRIKKWFERWVEGKLYTWWDNLSTKTQMLTVLVMGIISIIVATCGV